MSDNNQFNQNNYPDNGNYPYNQNQNGQYYPNGQNMPPRRPVRKEAPAPAQSSLSSTVKGIIAIMLTLLVVVIVIMVFAKSLFVNDSSEPEKTGVVTSTEYIPPATQTVEQKETEKTSKKTSSDGDEEDEDDYYDPYEDYQTITCTSAVYLHPEPTSSSSNLLTIPAGAECKFFRNENGWYYVEYNGTQGYAWNTFFSAPSED